MGWFSSGNADKGKPEVPDERTESRPSTLSDAVPQKKLPKELQKLVDSEDDFMDRLYDGQTEDSTESNVRYAAYASRVRTILLSAHRYVAYTSDIGESFRPIAHPYLVKGAYGISWAYLIGDVSHEGYKAYKRNREILAPSTDLYKDATGLPVPAGSEATAPAGAKGVAGIPAIDDYRAVMAERAVFQSVASMGLPAFTIHSIVRYSGKAFRNAKNPTIRTWAPITLGLGAVPALPYMFDEPVEKVVEWAFYHGFRSIGGPAAVGNHHPPTWRQEVTEGKAQKEEKEL